jgi:hypothetical protein
MRCAPDVFVGEIVFECGGSLSLAHCKTNALVLISGEIGGMKWEDGSRAAVSHFIYRELNS